jgi:N-acetylglutamate synthase-like GNAT family acetyltransferase
MDIRRTTPEDAARLSVFLRAHNAAEVARLGELVHALDHPALVAEESGKLAGVLSYVVSGSACEVLTLHVADPWKGVGSALLAELENLLRKEGCTRVWLITTNDNVDAMRFYQRRGFHLIEVHPGAVDASRKNLKSSIPARGNYGIPLRDELILEREL